MVVNAVQNKDNPPRIGYIKALVSGSVVGYSLKYMLPVGSHEKNDDSYKYALRQARTETRKDREQFIAKIRNSKIRTQAEDLFIKMRDNKEKIALNETQKADVKKIISGICSNSEKLFKRKQNAINAVIKDIRPTLPFVMAGAIVSLITAVTYNVTHQVAAERIAKQSKTEN